MDRLTQIRGEAGNSRDSTLDTTSPPSEAYMTANESSSKYFSLSEVDSTFDISSMKDDNLVSKGIPPIEPEQLISNLSPISKSNDLLGKQIEAANILSGGVNIFDDNDNSYDGDELVIDDNVDTEDERPDAKSSDATSLPESLEEEAKESKDTEVVLQIDGTNVDAIDIGNGLYLYRKEGQEELAAVQVVDDEQHQPSFKFLKVRENAEGNLEVYEEIEIEVPKEMPIKVGKVPEIKPAHVPIKDINKVINDSGNKCLERKTKPPQVEVSTASFGSSAVESETNKDIASDQKTEVNFNGKMMKISDARKSPLIGSFTPMTFHSTPNKEGVPLTKTMVNQQLQPSRGSDNVKKTIEVHTDSKVILVDTTKSKDVDDDRKKTVVEPFNIEEESETKEVKTRTELTRISTSPTEIRNTKKVVEEIFHKVETPEKEAELNDLVKAKDDSDKSKTNSVNHVQDAIDNANIKTVIPPGSVLNTNHINMSKGIPNLHSTKLEIEKTVCNKLEVENINKKNIFINSLEEPEAKIPENKGKSETSELFEKNVTKTLLDIKDTKNMGVRDKVLNTNVKLATQPLLAAANYECSKKDISATKDIKPACLPASSTKDLAEDVKKTGVHSTAHLQKEQHDKSSIKHSQLPDSKEVINPVAEKSALVLKIDNETKQVPAVNALKTQEIVKQNKNIILPDISNHQLVISATDTAKDIKQDKLTTTQKPAPLPVTVPSSTIDNAINTNIKSELHKPQNPDIKKSLTSNEKAKEVAKDVSVTMQNHDKKPINVNFISSNEIQEAEPVQVQAISIEPSTSSKTENIETGNEDDKDSDSKSENNNQAVPFGKWTEANRQEFLNKIKETKVPPSTSNTQQLKQTKDLNRRDVLKKIDSQRQSNNNSKMLDAASKPDPKNEKTFGSKSIAIQESKESLKTDSLDLKKQPTNITKVEVNTKSKEPSSSHIPKAVPQVNIAKKDQLTSQRKGIANQQLIESVINRAIPSKHTDTKQFKPSASKGKKTSKRDDIEMKMNELHGIPFIERPSHQLPKVPVPEAKKAPSNKITQIPNLVPYSNKNHRKMVTEIAPDIDSDEEIIEHEPVTGDSNLNKIKESPKFYEKAKQNPEVISDDKPEKAKKDAVITEKDFDKFARRNSFTYENSLTVNLLSNDSNKKQTVGVEAHKHSLSQVPESKVKPQNHHKISHTNNPIKLHTISKAVPISDDHLNKNYPSKVKMAYQSALTAKHQMESPRIIEDKPVKVIFMESHSDFTPRNINSHGQNLSPTKKISPDSDNYTCDSLDSEISAIETVPADEAKSYDVKNKSKHQRKQVLTPVETPELELIEPRDLGFEVSPKKKRRTEDIKTDKGSRSIVPKKTYLLNRSTADAKLMDVKDSSNNHVKTSTIHNNLLGTLKEPISALDNLVKAAELIENQAVNINKSNVSLTSESNITINSDSSVSTPVKRGRGRPRKNPMNISNSATETVKAPSPQKKPRLIDAKPPKYNDTEEDDSTDDDMVLENWTMGKINENIVCPICSKLFRSETVVFKHVKHCTGPSPNRSDSGKRSPRYRSSQESDSLSRDSQSSTDSNVEVKQKTIKETPKKRLSRELPVKSTVQDIIVIEDTPIKEKPKVDTSERESRKTLKPKIPQKSDLICEICGKTFRQLSYLVNHKMQHKKEAPKKTENKTKPKTTESNESKSRSIFSCEVCHKEFRKLHHLVQHRLIHSQNPVTPSKSTRKTSFEQEGNKTEIPQISKQSEDQSAGFRCEPCDKSFRKLHHLVEHRETHDGINRQKNPPSIQVSEEKLPAPPQCDVCKKTFRKLHHLIEHREQHVESSEKSDDKSALSTKDIIHECSTCYMVFPNEHSLNRHSVICLRKKRQSATKTTPTEECETIELDDTTESLDNVIEDNGELESAMNDSIKNTIVSEKADETKVETSNTVNLSEIKTKLHSDVDKNATQAELKPQKPIETKPETKSLKSAELPPEKDVVKPSQVKEIPKKKTPVKLALTVTKRQSRSSASQLPVVEENKSAVVESSDDDEIRYMFNPDFKGDAESKLFMKVRANKRNSLQIERPNSKDLITRRTSLQHPPKISRLKQKPAELNLKATISNVVETAASTDSDDSDVKYSFPKVAPEKTVLTNETVNKEQKPQRKSLAQKRKSLGGIAKRKSIGKSMTSKLLAKPTPLKQLKKRISEVEHRCDCGQLFSSAALLSRHTSAAHTPPRIRRRRSPPPEPKPLVTKPKKVSEQLKPKKESIRSDTSSTLKKSEDKSRSDAGLKKEEKTTNKRKSTKLGDEKSSVKSRRSIAHRGVPVPEKMRKLEKSLK